MEEELKKELGQDVDVELIAGSNGIFDVSVDGRVVFSKREAGRFPDAEDILSRLR
ncbi:MAG TPA: SelT/SelW/SelH family protein [Desulfobacteraceae bacterium]|nr:SelT/SelW/SelH family protein [Desulfobacteraceae bacterium]